MTKQTSRLVLLLMAVLSCAQGSPSYANPLFPAGNAADGYREVMARFQGLDDGLKRQMEKVISRGWTEENPELLGYLRQNAEAIELLKKATQIPFCDFGQGTTSLQRFSLGGKNESLYFFDKLGWFAKTLTVAGCRAVYEGLEKEALEDYLSVLRLGHHLGQEPKVSVLGKMMEFGCQKEVYNPIVRLIQRSSLKEEEYKKALEQLQILKAGWVGMDPVVQNDRFFVRSVIEKEFNSEIERKRDAGQSVEAITQRAQKALVFFAQLQKEYEGYFLEAYRKDAPEEFDRKADRFLDELRKKAAFFNLSPGGLEDINRFLASDCSVELVAQAALAISLIENSERIIRNYYSGRTRLHLIMGALAIRLYEMKNGEAPEKLEQLVPDYLPTLPEDPFVGDGSPVRYTKGEKEWYIFSAGPGRDVGGGRRQPIHTRDKEVHTSDLIITRKWAP